MVKKTSGKTKSYQARLADGLTPVFVWLTPAAVEALDAACSRTGDTKTGVIETMLVESASSRPPRAPRARREETPPAPEELARRVREHGAERKAVVATTRARGRG